MRAKVAAPDSNEQVYHREPAVLRQFVSGLGSWDKMPNEARNNLA